jgi:predicted MarR family transcription regulator
MKRQSTPDDWRNADRGMIPITRFEQSLQVVKNSFEQWVRRCGARAGMIGFASIEIEVLHIIGRAKEARRIADICFVLNVEDTHIVTYAVKKLLKAGLVESKRSGKDALFSITRVGGERMLAYAEVKRQLLLEAAERFSEQDIDLETLAEKMHVLASIYEKAARSAETHLT